MRRPDDDLADRLFTGLGDTVEEIDCNDGEFSLNGTGRIVTGVFDPANVPALDPVDPDDDTDRTPSAVLYTENHITHTYAWVHMTRAQVRELFGDYSVVMANETRPTESQVEISPSAFVMVVRQEGATVIELTVEGWGGQATVGLDNDQQRRFFYTLGALVDADGLT